MRPNRGARCSTTQLLRNPETTSTLEPQTYVVEIYSAEGSQV